MYIHTQEKIDTNKMYINHMKNVYLFQWKFMAYLIIAENYIDHN